MVEETAEQSHSTPSYPRNGRKPAKGTLPLHYLAETGIGLGFGNGLSGGRGGSGEGVGESVVKIVLMACGHVNILYAGAPIRVCSRPAGERGPIGVVVFTGEAGHVE